MLALNNPVRSTGHQLVESNNSRQYYIMIHVGGPYGDWPFKPVRLAGTVLSTIDAAITGHAVRPCARSSTLTNSTLWLQLWD
jgi:hypothetical protein